MGFSEKALKECIQGVPLDISSFMEEMKDVSVKSE